MKTALLLVLAIAVRAQQPAPPAQPAPPRDAPLFRGGITLVKVDALVMDRGGRVIPNLTQDDFQVFDEGQPQKISYFGHESEPLDLVLLLDVSGSMHRWLQEMAGNAKSALKQLHEGDRVALMLFDRRSEVREELTTDFRTVEEEMRETVSDKRFGGGTAIYDAILSAAGYIRGKPAKGRRAILIVTDNQSLNYKVTDEDVIRELYAADAVLNAILIGRQRRPDLPKTGRYVNPDFTPSDVFKLAEQTGGEAIESRKAGESLEQMIERIRSRYSIQYPAPEAAAGAFRRIRVELAPSARRRHPNAVIRARAGYYASQ